MVFKTWFQYRGNKQFGPFFGAEFDPNGHKNHEKYLLFFYQNNLTKKIHQTYYFGDDCMSGDKIIKKGK